MDRVYLKHSKRAKKGSGRRESISSIRIPESVKKEIDLWKSAYEKKYSCKVSYEQMLKWWMDNIGYTENPWDDDIRRAVCQKKEEHVFVFETKEQLVQYLNEKGRFWEYANHASSDISDVILITKSLLYLEFEDIPQLFALYGYEKCKEVFNREIKSKGKYYSNISFLLEACFF